MLALFCTGFGVACSSPTPVVSQPPLADAEAYLLRGDNFAEIQDYAHAILDYDRAILLQPDYAEAYNNRGYAYYWNGDATQAVAEYSRAIELRPAYAYAYNNRGAAYMASGNPDQAILDFTRAIQLRPDFPQAYTNRGNAYLRTGHFALAMADFSQAGQNPVGGFAVLCAISILMVLLVAIVAYRLWSSRARAVV